MAVGGARLKGILIECVLVGVCGAAFGLAANAISPKGLKLNRNYFPPPPAPATAGLPGSATTGATNNAGTNSLVDRLALRGISIVDSNYVAQAFYSPERAQNLVVFVDARDDAHYQKGHIPGAYQLDYYRPQAYLPALLPATMVAQSVIVYCNGGDCEDSEFAATLLNDAGVSIDRLRVYGGGFMEWSTNGLPVELGARDSQQFRQQ